MSYALKIKTHALDLFKPLNTKGFPEKVQFFGWLHRQHEGYPVLLLAFCLILIPGVFQKFQHKPQHSKILLSTPKPLEALLLISFICSCSVCNNLVPRAMSYPHKNTYVVMTTIHWGEYTLNFIKSWITSFLKIDIMLPLSFKTQ